MPVESLSEISTGLKASKGGQFFYSLRRQVPEVNVATIPYNSFLLLKYIHSQEDWSIWTWLETPSVISLLIQILFQLNFESKDNQPLMLYCRLPQMYCTIMILSCIIGTFLDYVLRFQDCNLCILFVRIAIYRFCSFCKSCLRLIQHIGRP